MATDTKPGHAELRWDEAPLRVYGIATWRTGFSWPACRIECPIPFVESIVPRTAANRVSIPEVVSDERPRTWRPFRDKAERRSWQLRVGDAADVMSLKPVPLPARRIREDAE